MAAEQGHAKAQFNLGVFCTPAAGVCRKTVLKWYMSPSRVARGQFNLGVMYALCRKTVPKP